MILLPKRMIVALALLTPMTVVPLTCCVAAQAASETSALGDLSSFEAIAADTLVLVKRNDLKAAEKRITDFETAWDQAEPRLYPLSNEQWGRIDEAADAAIASLRASNPTRSDAELSVSGLVTALGGPGQR